MEIAEQNSGNESPQHDVEEDHPPELIKKHANRKGGGTGHFKWVQVNKAIFYPEAKSKAKDFVDGSRGLG
jgi:hypothetical protein